MLARPQAQQPAGAAPPMRLRNPAEIAQVLSRIHDSHALLSVTIAGAPGTYSSILVGLDNAGGKLLLDALHPPGGDRLVHEGAVLTVGTRLDSSRVEFTCVIEQAQDLAGAKAYLAPLPRHLDYYERRSSYRLVIPTTMHLPPLVLESVAGPLRAQLTDISRRGAGALLQSQAEADIGTLVSCTIHLPDARVLTDAEVRSCGAQQARQRLGLLFSRLTPAQRHALDSSVAALERNLLRHYTSSRRH